jgi:hypothetical protein
MIHRESTGERFQLRARFLDRNALLEQADAVEEIVSARVFLLVQLQRHPDVAHPRKPPFLRHHPDDGDLFAVDRHLPANDAGIAAE